MGRETRQRVDRRQNGSKHRFQGFDCARKKHIMAMKAVECVSEIMQVSPTRDLLVTPAGIGVLNVWPPRIPLTYRLPADLGENMP